MKINALTAAGALTVFVALGALGSHRSGWAQSASQPAQVTQLGQTMYRAPAYPTGSGQSEFRRKVTSLVQQLRQAEGQEAQDKITAEARELFAQYFDADLEARQKQVDDLKDRIGNLEAQIEKRRQAKQEIIDLQLRVIRNEAEGLGFYGELAPGGYMQAGFADETVPSDGSSGRQYRHLDGSVRYHSSVFPKGEFAQ